MGKRIRVQRRGRGTPTFKATTQKRIAPAKYQPVTDAEKTSSLKGTVEELVHEPGRGTPLAKIRLENGDEYHSVVPEGVSVGQEIVLGYMAPIETGNVVPLGQVPSGTVVCNLELSPGDGGRIAKSSGAHVTVVAHTPKGTLVKLPSGKSLYLNDSCRATIGVVSGAGRTDKPFMKAGKKAAWMSAKGRVYPTTKGVAMVAAAHPHGGGAHKTQSLKPTTVSRGAPPGQKVGLIAARQSGRRKKRRRTG